MRIGPVGFLFVIVGGWAAVRAVMLWPERPSPRPPRIVWQTPLQRQTITAVVREPSVELASAGKGRIDYPFRSAIKSSRALSTPATFVSAIEPPHQIASTTSQAATPIYLPDPAQSTVPARSPLSLSAWSIVRGQSAPGLASAGQLGGSQAGIRARYNLGAGLAAAMRVSGPLRSSLGKEAALALDWTPIARFPFSITVERRIGLDRGGRDAFAAGAFGGFEAGLPLRMRVDGYAQVGVVGIKRRDGYIDGALRTEHALVRAGKLRLGAGAGLWGGAQPGASRLDAGPQLVAHVPIGGAAVRVGVEWRERVAGHARPGSGAALTLGADF